MHRFWLTHLLPMIETVQPARILEIGAELGRNTEQLLAWCGEHGSALAIVDPVLAPSLRDILARSPTPHTYHAMRSLDVLPLIDPPDFVLLDGDHNWHTVYHELQLLFSGAVRAGVQPPVIVMHDVGWPYARRDMYYDPGSLDPADRHPFAYRGILHGQSDLSDEGLNAGLANALHEGGPRNGVLTAVEDFVAAWPEPVGLYVLPQLNGLGILIPASRATPELTALVQHFFSGEHMMIAVQTLERDTMTLKTLLAVERTRAARRADALARARARILELEQALTGAR